jgi:hypothetical protein
MVGKARVVTRMFVIVSHFDISLMVAGRLGAEHSPHHRQVQGSSPAAAVGAESGGW